ncbi:M20/M25/M40 family metallo-hydrolase [Candidatus Poribacteria bacterium]|nr:M20/M25/M40 family metallo-hydrolase [Candidatus Poribacteria bacterium]
MSKNICILFISLLLISVLCNISNSHEVLVSVKLENSNNLENFRNIRFIGKDFALIQEDEDFLALLDIPYTLLGDFRENSLYYLVKAGYDNYHVQELTELGNILYRFSDSVVLEIEPHMERYLITMGLPIALLPKKIKLSSPRSFWMAPDIKTKEEYAADAVLIKEVIDAVSVNEIEQFILDLQENRDLDQPGIAYRSRYSLRVAETDDPSDDACDNAAEYIYNKFKSYGLDVEYDSFPHEVLTQGHYQMRNVVATLPGSGPNSTSIFVITAHYDSVASKSPNWQLEWKTMPAPGANDNASGVAAVLEAARILSQYDFDYTIKFITFSGEELGLHGSKHYTRKASEENKDIVGVLNFDMISYDPDELDIDVITNIKSEWLADAMLATQSKFNIGPLKLHKIINPEMVYSDHAPFWEQGWNAILSIDNSNFDSPEFYPIMHTVDDTIDNLNFNMASSMIRIAVGTLCSLADPEGSEPHPDLAIIKDDLVLSPENPSRGESVRITARIANLGKADARSVPVQVWLMEPISHEPRLIKEDLFDLEVNQSASIQTSVELTEWGNYEVLVKVNPGYYIFETNGRNNVISRSITLGSSSMLLGKMMLYPNPMAPGRDKNLNVTYTLSKNANTRMEIYDSMGNTVYKEYFTLGEPGGKFGPNTDINWDGTNQMGEKVSGGIYFCCIVSTDENGNTSSRSKKLLIIR